MVWRYAYGLDMILINFCHFQFLNFVILQSHIAWKCIDSGLSFKWISSYNFVLIFLLQVRHQLHRSLIYIWEKVSLIVIELILRNEKQITGMLI